MIDSNLAAQHRRLTILKHLAASTQFTSNASMLFDICNGVGVATSYDQLIGTLAWLQEQDLVTLTDHGDFTTVEANQRAVEIANGAVQHPGIKVPTARR